MNVLKLFAKTAPVVTAVGAGMLLYGALVEANNPVIERHTLALPGWPEWLRGYRIAVLADFHVRDRYSMAVAQKAVAMALDEEPDMVALTGDLVARWKPEIPHMIGDVLEPLLVMNGNVVAVPGNHEYDDGDPSILGLIMDELNIRLLRNESYKHEGITWVGIDSATVGAARPETAMEGVKGPAICLWHEPDLVKMLPEGCVLQLSGHTHGGQFRFPGGFTPMHTNLGRKYVRGYFPLADTPLYVSRGIGTTGPPSRFLCPPEVSILTLVPA